ncbi:VTT domain-containing protein [Horticoccus luteus]|uniref:VTT domain-containing protein n=1 Tax=Horticoccus luteus TaxID=2862869 RepID=A0A8F9TVP2_9BACT|nr:VTT domain-containing protein [Horticoccus luteus]QYM78437.1 VTT domain-containing protein [Horticoccus luteus]
MSASRSPSSRPPRRAPRVWAIVFGALALGTIAALLWRTQLDWHEVVAWVEALNAPLLLVLFCLLPLTGFSITVFYLVIGARFGPLVGGAFVAGATAVHLLGSHLIARSFLRGPLERFLARRHRHLPHIPEGENAGIALMGALVPGPPYFVRNYLLALSGVPLRIYFWICLPVYVARSYVALCVGDLADSPDARTLAILAGVYVVKLSVCAYVLWRLRRRYRLTHPATHPAAVT